MALSTPFRAVAAVIFGGVGIKKGIDDIADGNVLYGILEVIVGGYFVLTGLGDIIDYVQKYSSGPRGNSSGGSSS